jgi:hypothetical protein
MDDERTLIWVAVLGIGGYLWWKSQAAVLPLVVNNLPGQASAPPTVTINPAPQPVVSPVVVPGPLPVYTQASVNQNAVLPVTNNNPVVSLTPPVTVLQPPLAPFPMGTAIQPVLHVNYQPLVAPSPVNNALYMEFENKDYPQSGTTINPAMLHATDMM